MTIKKTIYCAALVGNIGHNVLCVLASGHILTGGRKTPNRRWDMRNSRSHQKQFLRNVVCCQVKHSPSVQLLPSDMRASLFSSTMLTPPPQSAKWIQACARWGEVWAERCKRFPLEKMMIDVQARNSHRVSGPRQRESEGERLCLDNKLLQLIYSFARGGGGGWAGLAAGLRVPVQWKGTGFLNGE